MPKLAIIGIPSYPFGTAMVPAEDGNGENATPVEERLTKVTNVPDARDVYGNSVWKKSYPDEQLAINSPRDPAGLENPEGGVWSLDGAIHCDDCKKDVLPEEMATPDHLGHNTRYADAKTNFDVANVRRDGRNYPLGPEVEGNESAWAAKPLETIPSPPPSVESAEPDTLANEIRDESKPI